MALESILHVLIQNCLNDLEKQVPSPDLRCIRCLFKELSRGDRDSR